MLVEALIELLLIYHLNQIKTNSKISFTKINSLPDTMKEDEDSTTITEDTIMENKNASKDDTILKNANN